MKLYEGYEEWSDVALLTGMIFGESRGEPLAGKQAVAFTAMTRAAYPAWWGKDLRSVILAEKQFSCWGDVNAQKIKDAYCQKSIVWNQCREVATDVFYGRVPETLGAPTHYHTLTCNPDWVDRLIKLATIGNHIFYHDPMIDRKKKGK